MKRFSIISVLFIALFLIIYFLRKSNETEKMNGNQNDSSDTIINETSGNTEGILIISFKSLEQFYPETSDSMHQILKYSGFDLCYNEQHEQADWVIYLHTKEKTNGAVVRKDNFREDKNVLTQSALPADYKNSGYDRGHLAPAADMKWSEAAMDESFLMSNMSPQWPQFNRGIWKKLEEKVRQWAIENDSIIVVTGPVFKNNKGTIGKNEVTVPGFYYKVILDISWPEYKAIAFLMKNEKSEYSPDSFAISIDSLESLSGINFFYQMKSPQFENLESITNLKFLNN